MTLEQALQLTKEQIKTLSKEDLEVVTKLLQKEIERINKRNGK